jgi:hypothetical protein
MNSYENKPILSKVCANCGIQFGSVSPHAAYCSLKCQNNAKRLRRKHRDASITGTFNTDARFYANVTDPTIEQLTSYAHFLATHPENERPVRFRGAIPMWTPPDTVDFIQTPRENSTEPNEWVMWPKVPDVMPTATFEFK